MFFFLSLVILCAELTIVSMLQPLYSTSSYLVSALLDASFLGILVAPVLWVLCFRLPVSDVSGKVFSSRRWLLFWRSLFTVCCVELLVMLVLLNTPETMHGYTLFTLDACLTTALVMSLLWRPLTRFFEEHQKRSIAEVFDSPAIHFAALLYIVFIADAVQETIQPLLIPRGYRDYYVLIDSILTTLIIAPFVWVIIGKSLTKAIFLEKSRAKTILDQVIDAVITIDKNGRIQSLNPAAKQVFMPSGNDLQGQSVWDLFPDPGLNIKQTITKISSQTESTNDDVLRDVACKSAVGPTKIMDVSVSRIQQHGNDELLMIFHDIGQHKEAERAIRERDERFRQIFDQSLDAIVFFKPQSLQIIDFNTTFAELFGRSKSEMSTFTLDEIVKQEDYLRVKNAILTVSRDESAVLDSFVGLRNDGTEFYLSMRGKLMKIDTVSMVFCSFREITNRIRMEKEARDIQARLIQANKMTSLGLMVSGVAHEINNPNSFILANSKLLAGVWEDARKVLDEYYRENGDFCLAGVPFSELEKHSPKLFSGIIEGSSRINEIVDGLKNFYRSEPATQKSPVDINQIVTSATSLLHHELINYTDNFNMSLADNLPSVVGYGQQIGQVIINLLMNACQALPTRKHGIWLETAYDPDSRRIILKVKDEGCGMSIENSQKVMDPFFTTKLDDGGTGLGLSICGSIVKEHMGSLTFDSRLGEGTTFVVSLPTVEQASKD